MAIKLVTEVMDWAPPLTHREHKVLMILAENARLSTRETWDSVESPRILRRAQLTRSQMYAVIAELVKKGCLDKPVWGAGTTAPSTGSRISPYRGRARRRSRRTWPS
jgi:DNA-binding MarR family transcriptional regulator